MSYLPSYILAWLNDDNDEFMYTEQHVARFPFFHLEARGWYLDCFDGCAPNEEEPLINNLAKSAPMAPAPLEEPEEVEP